MPLFDSERERKCPFLTHGRERIALFDRGGRNFALFDWGRESAITGSLFDSTIYGLKFVEFG